MKFCPLHLSLGLFNQGVEQEAVLCYFSEGHYAVYLIWPEQRRRQAVNSKCEEMQHFVIIPQKMSKCY